jgi:hypothetical protein
MSKDWSKVLGRIIISMESYIRGEIMLMENCMGYMRDIIPMESYLGGLIMLMEINVG